MHCNMSHFKCVLLCLIGILVFIFLQAPITTTTTAIVMEATTTGATEAAGGGGEASEGVAGEERVGEPRPQGFTRTSCRNF